MLTGKKLGILGVGKIGEALVTGLIRRGGVRAEDILGSVRRDDSLKRATDLGIAATTDSAAVVARSDIILIATKPQAVEGLLSVIDPAVRPGQLFISVAASVPTAYIETRLGHPVAVVRAMPNTPCMLGAGMTVL